MQITYQSIGVLHSPFRDLEQMPIQPTGRAGEPGSAEILAELAAGLKDLEGFSHLLLVYHLHQAGRPRLSVTPFLDDVPHGIFATRAPARPNPIGLSTVELLRVEGTTLHLSGVDFLDGSPLLDIKPYVPRFDAPRDPPRSVRLGWLEHAEARAGSTRSDDRFTHS